MRDSTKYIIRGKTYTLIEYQPVGEDFIKLRAKVQNSKKEYFTLVKTYGKYSLYDANSKLVLTTTSIREI